MSRGHRVEPWWCPSESRGRGREGVGVAGPAGISAWSERRAKSWGGISGFKSRSGGAKRGDQVPARSRSLAEAGWGDLQGAAQAWRCQARDPKLASDNYRTPSKLPS